VYDRYATMSDTIDEEDENSLEPEEEKKECFHDHHDLIIESSPDIKSDNHQEIKRVNQPEKPFPSYPYEK